jgi:hypothetical protein
MASTLNVDVAVNPTQLQSAVQSIQNTVSSAGAAGAYGNISGFMPSGGGGVGGGSPRPQFFMPSSPLNYFAQQNAIPMAAIMARSDAAVGAVMQNVGQAGAMAMENGAQFSIPKNTTSGFSRFLGSAAEAIVSTGVMIGGGLIGTAMGGLPGGLIGGIGASTLYEKAGTGEKIKRYFSSSGLDPNSEEYAAQVKQAGLKLQEGARNAALMGYRSDDFLSEKGYYEFAKGSAGKFAGVAKDFNVSEGRMHEMVAIATANNPEMMDRIQRESRVGLNMNTGKYAYTGMFNVAGATFGIGKNNKAGILDAEGIQYLEDVKNAKNAPERLIKESKHVQDVIALSKYGDGMSLAKANSVVTQASLIARGLYSQNQPDSPFTQLGKAIGSQFALGSKEGQNLVNSYIKKQSQTDLGITDEVKKNLGGSVQIAGRYATMMMNNAAVGGKSFAYMALIDKGISPSADATDISSQVAGAYGGDLSGQVNLMGGYHKKLRTMGGAQINNAGRLAALSRLQLAREATGISEKETSDSTLLSFMYQGEGMSGDEADAQANATLGIGKASIGGGGTGLVAFGSITGNAFESALSYLKNDKKTDMGKIGINDMSGLKLAGRDFERKFLNQAKYKEFMNIEEKEGRFSTLLYKGANALGVQDKFTADTVKKIQQKFNLTAGQALLAVKNYTGNLDDVKWQGSMVGDEILSNLKKRGVDPTTFAAAKDTLGGDSAFAGKWSQLAAYRTAKNKNDVKAMASVSVALGSNIIEMDKLFEKEDISAAIDVMAKSNYKVAPSGGENGAISGGTLGQLATTLKLLTSNIEVIIKEQNTARNPPPGARK